MADQFDEQWLRGYFKDYEKFLTEVLRDQTLTVWSELTNGTPVDTGRARASWFATAGKPSKSVYPPVSEGNIARRSTPKIQQTRVERPNYVVNNLEYIIPLAEGHSAQAPAGWVDDALTKAQKRTASKVGRLIRKHRL